LRRNRDRKELYYLVLKVCQKETIPIRVQDFTQIHQTHVAGIANDLIKYNMLKRYERIIENSRTMRNGPQIFLKTTPKGDRYVQIYSQMLDSIKGYEGFN
jgi:hypothetical protein